MAQLTPRTKKLVRVFLDPQYSYPFPTQEDDERIFVECFADVEKDTNGKVVTVWITMPNNEDEFQLNWWEYVGKENIPSQEPEDQPISEIEKTLRNS